MRPSVFRINRGICSHLLLLTFAVMTGAVLAQATQEARVAASALKIEPLAGEQKIKVSLRLLDAVSVIGVEAKAGAQTVPAVWRGFDAAAPPGGCAWLVVVDTSNPARQRTVEACAGEVRAFLKRLPKGDTAMVATLARDLEVAAPFGSSVDQVDPALDGMKADGDAAFTSLIFQNVKHALSDHLARRPEARRCVVLLTDGKDETPGGPLRITERRNELIAEAKKLGIPIHTLGFAEKATEANYFADLKEASIQTDGLHFPAAVASRQLPADTWPTLIGVMHSGGEAMLDLAGLKTPAALRLEMTCAESQKAVVAIPQEMVKAALPATAPAAAAITAPVPLEPEPAVMPPAPPPPPAIAFPGWYAWLAGGVIALLLMVAVSRPKNKKSAAVDPAGTVVPIPGSAGPEVPRVAAVVAMLEVVDTGRRHPVTAAGAKIGSGGHNDIVVDDDSVSADHCMLSLSKGEWVIADTGSVNGLRVNGTYYHQATVNPDDVIHIGEVRLRLHAAG